MAFSLIDSIDGSEDCEGGSRLGYWGLILWTLIIIYLFVGLYVLCEIYFVPILISISKRLNMSEDVAGATLMAAGSSAPELFTALIGVLFYANENPGPSTNCASAAFNMCVIIGCSIFFCGYKGLPIRGYPFIRDCFFYAIAVIELYLFWEVITPGEIQWGESLTLVLSWTGYIVVLAYNNKVIKICVSLMSWMGLTNAEEMLYEQLKSNHPNHLSKKGNISDYSDYDDDISEYQNIKTGGGSHTNTNDKFVQYQAKSPNTNTMNDDMLGDSDDDDHSRHFIAMELEEVDTEQLNKEINQKPNALRILKRAPKNDKSDSIATTQPSNAGSNNMDIATSSHPPSHGQHGHDQPPQSKCGRYFHNVLYPFHIAFKYTIPKCDNDSSTPKLSISFFLVLVWLGILTFICVDSAEKMGNCLKISEDVMGLTILAIGSSLPDCFSSVLAAKQGKGEMAVSNALGSNVFDINICIGVSFLLKSIITGASSITVESDEGFELFIAALFVLLAIFMVAMFCYGLVLNKMIGAGLLAAYAVFLGAFSYLLQYDD